MPRTQKLLLALITIFCALPCYAQTESAAIQSRILILLDESSSMIKPWANGQPKYKVADAVIMRLMDSLYAVNRNVELSLRVFGHQSTVEENNCYDTKNEVPFGKGNQTQMALRLAAIRPLGVTPIAYSLIQAAEQDLTDPDHNAYSIILITDGGESCGGDICAVMKALIEKKVYFRPYIIGLEADAALSAMYACMGNYLQVTKEDDISRALKTIITSFQPLLNVTSTAYKELQVAPVATPQTETSPIVKKPAAEKIPAVAPAPVKLIAGSSVPTNNGPTLPSRTLPALPSLVNDALPGMPSPRIPQQKMEAIPTVQIRPVFLNVAKLIGSELFSFIAPPPLPPFMRDTVTLIPVLAEPVKPMKEDFGPNFKLTTVDAKETSLELYFVNAKGKPYMSKPLVRLVDHADGHVEREFRRVVDGLGNIDVQTKIPTGYYNLVFPTKKGLVMNNVYFAPKKKNKIMVRVNDTKLTFAYADAPSRPVSEFKAVVTRLNAPPGQDRVQTQKGSEMMEYEPGTYKIEINTLPKDTRIVDMDFNEDTVITILQPGYGKFTSVPLDKHFVKLYFERDGEYRFFYTLDVNDPESQHLHLQPGAYQVRYEKGRKGTVTPELVVPFVIKPNEETSVDIQ